MIRRLPELLVCVVLIVGTSTSRADDPTPFNVRVIKIPQGQSFFKIVHLLDEIFNGTGADRKIRVAIFPSFYPNTIIVLASELDLLTLRDLLR